MQNTNSCKERWGAPPEAPAQKNGPRLLAAASWRGFPDPWSQQAEAFLTQTRDTCQAPENAEKEKPFKRGNRAEALNQAHRGNIYNLGRTIKCFTLGVVVVNPPAAIFISRIHDFGSPSSFRAPAVEPDLIRKYFQINGLVKATSFAQKLYRAGVSHLPNLSAQ